MSKILEKNFVFCFFFPITLPLIYIFIKSVFSLSFGFFPFCFLLQFSQFLLQKVTLLFVDENAIFGNILLMLL